MPPHNLPHELSSFVGREQELAALTELLVRARVLTLVGPGGAGKTRLALRLASQMMAEFPDGVWLVELAALRSSELVPQAIASAIGVHERSRQPAMQAVAAAIGNSRMLIVLDNCEHLVAACADVVDQLLRTSPNARVVATSREPLGLVGELVWSVPPLGAPAALDDHRMAPSNLVRDEAVRLFVERASAVNSRFALTDANADAIASICKRVDRLPLAIELAAARVNVLSPVEIAHRLDDRFELLVVGSRTADPRQQTLRAALNWSLDLLNDSDRQLFARLSVFPASFTLAAVEGICAGPHESALDALANLVNRSLVVLIESAGTDSPDDPSRYRLLETLRVLAAEHLADHGETASYCGRHAAWFCAKMEQARLAFHGPDEGFWLRWAEREHDNLLQAIDWSVQQSDASTALRLATSAYWPWALHMHWSQACGVLRRVIALPEAASLPALRCEAVTRLGEVSALKGDVETARAAFAEAAELALALGDEQLQLSARGARQILLVFTGDVSALEQVAEDLLEHARQIGFSWAEVRALETLAHLAVGRGDHAVAVRYLSEAEQVARSMGDNWSLARVLQSMGDLRRSAGEHQLAGVHYDECQQLFRGLGLGSEPSLLHNLGYVLLAQGDGRGAAERFREAMSIFRRAGDLRGVAECVIGIACVEAAWSHAFRAVRLFGAGRTAMDRLGTELWLSNVPDYDRWLDVAHKRMTRVEFEGAWSEGSGWSLERAQTECVPDQVMPPHGPEALTVREREVAALVAQGLTNRQVAKALVVTEKTVANHLQHVLEKLDLHSRGQLTARAPELGLTHL
jgi:non-specific serine/threonine protein kinase